jgi:GntR family transcriptional regulator
MYETVYGIPMVRAEEKLTAVAATPEQARMLDVAPGSPLLRVERVAYTYGDKPMEWRVGLCVTDEHHYMNELE